MSMDNSTSSFPEVQKDFPDAERLQVGGTTCECYRVKLYGKLHFLKRLKPELRTHPQYVAALQKEFEMGYQLDHPHLVRYVGKTDDGILMDYVDGETLGQFVERHPDYFRNRNNADRFLSQLLSVVGYLHSHQIVHLDLKPSNILITRIGHDVKLIDLGYCYADCYTDTTGCTDKYAAPEQLNGSAKPDARTDIYAIGRVLQTLPCAHYYNKVSKRCTAKDMDERYASVDELQQAVCHRRTLWRLIGVLAFVVAALLFFLAYHYARQEFVVADSNTVSWQSQSDSLNVPESQCVPRQNPDHRPIETDIEEHPAPVTQTEVTTSETPLAVSEPASAAVAPISANTQREDTLALRRELQQLIGSRFKKALGHYNDSTYHKINHRRYTQKWIDFEGDLIPLYSQVWKSYQGKVVEHTLSSEWCQTIMYYRVTQLWKMIRNDPNHDPSYDHKVFHYYEIPCQGM